ncbi:hypothetical protein [Priestia aryabhattai]|uniref:hypothetical protein n=1 Tax=Priestia aryabhattai TaxID=412384 RepID=UPI0032E84EB3
MRTLGQMFIGAIALLFLLVIFTIGYKNFLLAILILYGIFLIAILFKQGLRRGSVTAIIYLFIFTAIYYLHAGLQALIRITS